MLGPILVTLLVAVIVVSYITLVNRMLRTDKHWHETDMLKPTPKKNAPQNYGAKMTEASA